MAHYRNITVADVAYRYVVGREVTKVQNRATGATRLYKNIEWGTPRIDADYDDCKWREDGKARYYPRGHIVTPGDVKGMITQQRHWQNHPCNRHPNRLVTGLTSDPFDGEIKGKITLRDNCPDCLAASWMNT